METCKCIRFFLFKKPSGLTENYFILFVYDQKTPVWPESPSKTADATTDMTGLGNSGWLKGESRWKPPRVAAAAVDMKQPRCGGRSSAQSSEMQTLT